METTLGSARKIAIHRWGGAAFILGNLFFLANKLDEMSRLFLSRRIPDIISGQNPLIILVGQAALIIGYLANHRQYVGRLEKPGRIALGLFTGGGMLVAAGHTGFIDATAIGLPGSAQPALDMLFLFVLAGMLLLIPGLIWFGLLNLRQRILAKWQWLPLTTGLMGFAGFFLFTGEEINAIFLVFRTLFALGLVGLGLIVCLEESIHEPVARSSDAFPTGLKDHN